MSCTLCLIPPVEFMIFCFTDYTNKADFRERSISNVHSFMGFIIKMIKTQFIQKRNHHLRDISVITSVSFYFLVGSN